jgi:GWxTD domain-containing protein
MAGFGRATAAAADPGGEEATGRDTLLRLSEAALDAMYAPLVYLLDPAERGLYQGLTVDGKRTFLRRFWAKRDPTPGTPRNEFEEVFYQTVAEASSRFREGGSAAVPGWRSDRGRIYILYGPPDDVFERPQAGSGKPYEVWKYTKKKSRRFIFLDRTSMGNYELIWTDERREPSRPDWQALLGPEALVDAMQF